MDAQLPVPGDADRYADMKTQLPEQISYMGPFVKYLESLPQDELDESVDPTILVEALRKRLACGDSETVLDSDRTVLEVWLDSFDSVAHPAHWIQGFIFSLTAAEIFDLRDEVLQTSAISIEPRFGWTASNKNSELRKGNTLATLLPIDAFAYENFKISLEQPLKLPPIFVAERSAIDVEFGESHGRKYLQNQTLPRPEIQIDYLLTVPGGFAWIRITEPDRDFNDSELEALFSTLSIVTGMA